MSQTERVTLGTAGHIDHGKTELIRALTGQETDRLPAEKERGISIELGFAHYELQGHRFGVIDVPGHERFIRQMLAGVHGIDLVLFTIAADDGIMPQTEEHFDILHLLGAHNGIFVITKADLVDEARIEELRADIEVLAVGTPCENWPVLVVSSRTGQGLESLRDQLARTLPSLTRRKTDGYFRLPIDRSFTLHGHGLVVTGTAIAGCVEEGTALAIRPGDSLTRARSIQVHGESVPRGLTGQRVAINLPGIEPKEAPRGHWLTDPRIELTTDRMDCWFEVRPGAPRPLRSFDQIRIYVATAEIMGRIILLDGKKELPPKSSGWCQIVTDEPILATAGDRFIARTQTATRTTGGGEIVHPFAPRHRSTSQEVIQSLQTLRTGNPQQRLQAFVDVIKEFAVSTEFIAQGLNQSEDEVRSCARLSSELLPLPEATAATAWTTPTKWKKLTDELVESLETYHRAHPISPGMDLESLRSRLRIPLPAKLFRPVVERLEAEGTIVREGTSLKLPRHRIILEKAEEDGTEAILRGLNESPFSPPDLKQLASDLNMALPKVRDLVGLLEGEGKIVRVSSDICFAKEAFDEAERRLRNHLDGVAEITVADYRTSLSASRKYAMALLDHFDRTGVTVRIGDARRLRAT